MSQQLPFLPQHFNRLIWFNFPFQFVSICLGQFCWGFCTFDIQDKHFLSPKIEILANIRDNTEIIDKKKKKNNVHSGDLDDNHNDNTDDDDVDSDDNDDGKYITVREVYINNKKLIMINHFGKCCDLFEHSWRGIHSMIWLFQLSHDTLESIKVNINYTDRLKAWSTSMFISTLCQQRFSFKYSNMFRLKQEQKARLYTCTFLMQNDSTKYSTTLLDKLWALLFHQSKNFCSFVWGKKG